MQKNILIVSFLSLIIFITGCHNEKNKQQQQLKTVTAALRAVPTELFYTGTISPVRVNNITSTVDGTVKQLFFKYGQKVDNGQLLMIISSPKLQDDYRTAVTNYLKAKEDNANSIVNFRGSTELKDAGIISEQEYLSEKSSYDNTAIAYLNAQYQLEQTIAKIPGVSKTLESLSLDDLSTISKILQIQYDNLQIIAPAPGIILMPEKTEGGAADSGTGDSDKKLIEGAQVKQGQVLVSIGDLSGLATTVQVSELAINQIKTGQAVIVTSDALPGIEFHGFVKSVGAQAQPSPEGGLATFPVVINVPTITTEQAQLIRVGMTTKIEIVVENKPKILIPLAAVFQKNGISMVTILDPKTGKTQDVPVQTGQTSVSDVTIISGIKPGDQVVVP